MSARKKTVFVVYYSMYGHIEKMARAVCKGLEKSGVSAKLYQVIKTNPAKSADVPIISAADLPQADGILFGIPTRFGMVPAQIKSLMDSCGQLWMKGELYCLNNI